VEGRKSSEKVYLNRDLSSYLPTKHPRHSVLNLVSTGTFIDLIVSKMLSDFSVVASSSTISHLASNSFVPSSSEPGGSSPEPEAVYPCPWPKNYHTCDIIDGFRHMDSTKMMDKFPSVEDRFLKVFKQGLRSTTYYNACHRLKTLKQEDIDRSKAAMRTPEGLWSHLAKSVSLRKQ
jgi:hypothetical protein